MSKSVKVEVTALVLRDKEDNSIIAVYPVRDYDTSVLVVYQRKYIPTIDDVQKAVKDWGETTKRGAYYAYMEGQDIVLEDDAKHMPSMGNITAKIETKMIDWE